MIKETDYITVPESVFLSMSHKPRTFTVFSYLWLHYGIGNDFSIEQDCLAVELGWPGGRRSVSSALSYLVDQGFISIVEPEKRPRVYKINPIGGGE